MLTPKERRGYERTYDVCEQQVEQPVFVSSQYQDVQPAVVKVEGPLQVAVVP